MARKVGNGLDLDGQPIIGLPDPTSDTDAANKRYVDAASRGLAWKAAVRAASTGTLNLAAMPAAVDGVALANGDRFLAKDQAAAADRGIYTFAGTGNPAVRAIDADSNAEVRAGMTVTVTEGATNGDKVFRLITDDPIDLGVTTLTFTEVGGLSTPPAAGDGLTYSGGTYAVGAGTGIVVTADLVAIDPAVVTRKAAANIGDGAATSIDVVHGLGSRDVTVTVYRVAAPYDEIITDVEHKDVNTVTVKFAIAPAVGQYRAVIHG